MALTKVTVNELSNQVSSRIDAAFTTANTANSNASGAVPKITNVQIANSTYYVLDDTAVNVGGGYIVVTGAGFQSGAQVIIDTTPATSTTFVNSATLRAQVPTKSAATYNLYVVNSDGGTAIKVNGLTYSGIPTWVTGSTLDGRTSNNAFTGSFSATGATSYAVAAGSSLPTGMTLVTANGYYYGTISVGSETTYNFTINATDDENQDVSRSFSLTVSTVAAPTIYLTGEQDPLVDTSSSPLTLSVTNVSRSTNQVHTGSYSILINGTGKNILFQGTNSSIWDLGTSQGTNTISGAFEMQIYPMTPAASRCAIIGRYNEPGEIGWTVDYNGSGNLFLGSGGSGSQTGSSILTFNQWQKLAIVYENISGTFYAKIYKNNSLVDTLNMSSAASPSSSYNLMLAPRSSSLSLNAYIDEFKFWRGNRGPY